MWRPMIVMSLLIAVVAENCREQVPKLRPCENICNGDDCTIQAALLLPANSSYAAALPAVEPVLDLALQHHLVREAFPSWIKLKWRSYDVTDCDAAYAVISAVDAYNDCAHVFLGPSCDFALASVARIAKFLGNTGIPILSTGGFTFDFVRPKKTCDDEYYMLVRAGLVGFQDIAYFIINIMWK